MKLPPVPQLKIPKDLMSTWLTGALDAVFEKPRPPGGKGRTEMRRLLRDSVQGLIKSARKDREADRDKWKASLRFLETRVEIGHGLILGHFMALNVLLGGMLPVRSVNRRMQMIKGWSAVRWGEPVTIGWLRKNPRRIANFPFVAFLKALKTAGSERAFIDQFCRRAPGSEEGAGSTRVAADRPRPASTGIEAVQQGVRDLATAVQRLPAEKLPAAAEEVSGLLAMINSNIRASNGAGGVGSRAVISRNVGWKPNKEPRK